MATELKIINVPQTVSTIIRNPYLSVLLFCFLHTYTVRIYTSAIWRCGLNFDRNYYQFQCIIVPLFFHGLTKLPMYNGRTLCLRHRS